jgi:mannobiose 2-epimerase
MSRFYFLSNLIMISMLMSCDKNATNKSKSINWDSLANDIELELSNTILDRWYPLIIDTVEGGYLSNLSSTFVPSEVQNKMIVTQSRHMWATAMVAKRKSDAQYLEYAAHGLPFLQKMWDPEFGGFYQHVDRSGNAIDESKTAYGNAFAIYGLSAYFDASGDTAALNLAKKTFLWLEENSHDAELGGYFQDLNRLGEVIQRSDSTSSNSTVGYKDQNSSIHLLEAFTSLYKVWPDPLVKERLLEMYFLIKDVMFNDDHYLNLFFTADLKPVSFNDQDSTTIMEHAGIDHVSFGHDIETAYLLLEASEALGMHHDQALLDELKQIVDHALLGLDPVNGGLFDQGYYFRQDGPLTIIKDSKEWWAQAEALNTLLIFHHFYPDAGYDQQFVNMWNYIRTNLIDHENGGWFVHGIDTRPNAKEAPKATIWKSTYHNYRALANIAYLLQHHDFS